MQVSPYYDFPLLNASINKTKKKKVLFFFGTRPELIKLYPLHIEFSGSERFEIEVAYTGQHDSLIVDLFEDLSINPQYRGSVLSEGQTLNILHSKLFEWADQILAISSPDIVIVHGDTATAAITGQAAKYRKILIAHIEAGLRTHNINNPFPEEINRKIIGCIADFHFAPTVIARDNLIKEGIHSESIFVVGNTIVDAIRLITSQMSSRNVSSIRKKIIITMHRRENHGANIDQVSLAIELLFASSSNIDVCWIVHPNANSKPTSFPKDINNNSFRYLPHMSYSKFIRQLSDTSCIITDSGGLQEEAAILNIDTLVIRELTERPETLKSSAINLTNPSATDIVNGLNHLLHSSKTKNECSPISQFSALGDGYSSKNIHEILSMYF